MPAIDPKDTAAIKAQADIVDIISRYIPTNRKGKDYVAVCPFHDDHDPSMHISTDRQLFKCFVCGTGGDVFTFVQKMEKISFPESIVSVAGMIGYPLEVAAQSFKPRPSPFDPLYKMMAEYIDYSEYILSSQDGARAREYLKERKFSRELIEKFQIGFVPDSNVQKRFINLKKWPDALLRKTGLVYANQPDLSPVFYDRITIPIHDEHGHPVGLTARKLPDSRQEAKYINTSTTEIYNKGNLLFNYHRAKEAARKSRRLFLVEGAMDVLGLAKAGIDEGIAALGTAFTREQMTLIRRLNVPVSVFYDSDAAGQKACWKFGKAALEAGISFSVVSNSLGKDPDEIYCQYGEKTLRAVCEKTIPFVEFAFHYLQSEYHLDNYEDKKAYAAQIASLIQKTLDEHEAPLYYQRLRELTGFSYEPQETGRELSRRIEKNRRQKMPEVPLMPVTENGRQKAEKAALSCMLVSERYVNDFMDEIGYFQDEACQALSLLIYDIYRKYGSMQPDLLLHSASRDEVRNLLVDLLSEDHEISDEFFHDSLIKIRESMLTEQIEQLNTGIRMQTDAKSRLDLIARKQALIVQKLALRERKDMD